MSILSFPNTFIWGSATAAYQIEGAALEDGRCPSIWDTFSHTPGKTLNGDTGDVACDHYHHMLEDVALMKRLGLKAYRFSIAWPRIMPNGAGAVNQMGIDFYSRLVDALLAAGIEPIPTLYHWDLPQTLEDLGGWANIETAGHFADYAEVCYRSLGDRVHQWITLNEPWCSADLGYRIGVHAPGVTDLGKALAAGHTLLLAHGMAVQRLRNIHPESKVGITVNLSAAHPATTAQPDVEAAKRWDAYMNRWFLDPIYKGDYPIELREEFGNVLPVFTEAQRSTVQCPTDFVGVNYYSRSVCHDDPASFLRQAQAVPDGAPVTAMGWEIYPGGLYELLTWLRDAYGSPVIYITENGAAFDDVADANGVVADDQRIEYLREHFIAAHRAIGEGVKLHGYFVWSLMDNFEWALGYSKRFGIVHVDYTTQKRTPKHSAEWYAQVIRQNAVSTND